MKFITPEERMKPAKLTPEQQVKKALRILAPAESVRKKCDEDVCWALEEITVAALEEIFKPQGKEVRAAVKRYVVALRRCQAAFNALYRLDLITGGAVAPRNYREDIASYEAWLDEAPDKPRRIAHKNRASVQEARKLIIKYCSEKDLSLTRRSKWHRLSAVLAGDEDVDLFNIMLKIRPNQVSK
jgi:hypothetical protein